MDPTRLKKLRIQQFILMNSFILVAVIIFTLLIDRFSLSSFQRVAGIIIFSLAIFGILKKTTNLNVYGLFPSMRELMKYEKNKLGNEYPKTRWLHIASQLFVSVILLTQSFFQSAPHSEIPLKDTMLIAVPVVLVLLAAMNIALIYHSKKVDSGTNESLKGFTMKSILVGVAIGVPSAFILTMLLILIISVR
jgi:glucan phosphoethanolaminetransferase (alkaline phosphatase superfamily)